MTFAQISFYPEQGSTLAPRVDSVFGYIFGVSAFFSLLIALLVIVFAVRYRRRSPAEVGQPLHGSTALEVFWIVVPLLLSLVMFFWGAHVYVDQAQAPEDSIEVYVVARQWMWKMQHAGGQREIDTLHVPVGRPVKLYLTSEDVIHSFYVPAFRMKQDVLPGRYTHTWFQATEAKTYHLFCAEYCGTNHSRMRGEIVVLEPADYQRWLSEHAEGSLALQGRKLFTKLQCITCHTGTGSGRCPSLEDVYNARVPLEGGGWVVADESYLRESILSPRAKIVAGFRPIMPTYQDQVNEEELVRLVAFLRGLKAGQTPPRVEETPAPEVPAPEKEEGRQ